MAVIIKPKSKPEPINPKNGKTFSLKEISEMIGGIVEPTFLNGWWIFMDRFSEKKECELNKKVTEILGVPIYGTCVFSEQKYLPKEFFFPEEVINEMIKNIYDEIINQYYTSMNDLNNSSMKNIENDEVLDKINQESIEDSSEYAEIMEKAYTKLIEERSSYDELLDNFVIYESPLNTIVVPDDKKERLVVIDKIIDYFIKQEEYRKCQKLQELRVYIEKNT